MIIQADFQQGAWISALQDLERYFVARREFDPNPMDVIEDAIYRESLFNAALIIAAAPKVSSQVYGYIEYIKSQMGDFFDSELAHLVDEVNRTIDEMGLDTLLNAKLLSSPFSDLGAQRTIDWKALGVQWKVTFDNDFVTNSVAEEFCAFMQIIQVELALTKTDLHLIGNTMNFSVSLSNEIKEPVVIRHNRGEYEWRLFLPVLDNDAKDFRMHNAQMSTTVQFVLNLISLLPKEEFKGIYFKLFENNGLAQKTVSANSYQRMYRRLVDQKQFEEAQRSNFESVDHPVLLSQHPALNAEDSLSPKYDQEAAKDRIRIRYEKSLKPIQITFDKLIKDEKFHDLVRQLRKDGWLDWQILMSLTNAVCNYKANLLVQGKQYVTHESFAKDFNKGFQSFFDEEESLSNYVDIPFEEIRSDLKHQLELLSIHVLPSFDLESKSEKPDVKGIKEMLQKRFNFMTDDTSGENPLAVIST
ncbi:MAG: hypothetical protein R2813_11900 [Flavobacteriales bacterium]